MSDLSSQYTFRWNRCADWRWIIIKIFLNLAYRVKFSWKNRFLLLLFFLLIYNIECELWPQYGNTKLLILKPNSFAIGLKVSRYWLQLNGTILCAIRVQTSGCYRMVVWSSLMLFRPPINNQAGKPRNYIKV